MIARDTTIDNIKGLGMILVILGHMSIWEELHLWIYSFHMPLFTFISAIFIKKFSKEEFMNKVKRLLIPFFAFSLLSWLCYAILTFCFYPSYLSEQFMKLLYILAGTGQNAASIWENGNVTLWFLPFLFLSLLTYWWGGGISQAEIL